MARLEIEIKGPSGGAASSTRSTGPTASPQQQVADLTRVEQLLQRQAKLVDAMVRSQILFGQEGQKAATNIGLKLQRIAEQTDRQFSQVAAKISVNFEAAARRADAAWAKVGTTIQRSAAAALRGATPGLGQVGGALSGGIGALTSGNLIGGAVPRAAGLAGGGLLRAAGSVGAGVATSLSSSLSDIAGGFGDLAKSGAGAGSAFIGGVYKTIAGAGSVIAGALGSAFAIAGSVGGAVLDAVGEIAGFVGDKLGTALKVSVGAAVGVAFAGLAQFAKAEDVTPAFERLAKASGTTLTQALESLRAATKGTVSDVQLMTQANRASELGAIDSVQQYAQLASAARVLGKAVGTDATTALEKLLNGIDRMSPRLLSALGISIKVKDANEAYAQSIGKTAKDLSEHEQRQAFLNAVLEKYRQISHGVGADTIDVGDRFEQLHAKTANLLEAIGGSLAPAFEKLVDAIEPAITAVETFVQNNADEAGRRLAAAIGNVGTSFADVQTLAENSTLDDVFKAAALEADNIWIRMKAGAGAAFDYASLKAQEFWEKLKAYALDNAGIIGFATGGVPGSAAALAFKAKAHLDAGGSVVDNGSNAAVDQARARASALGAQASAISFSPQGENAQALDANTKAIDDLINEIRNRNQRANLQPVQQTVGTGAGRISIVRPPDQPTIPLASLTTGLTSPVIRGGAPSAGGTITGNLGGLVPQDSIAKIAAFFQQAESEAANFAESSKGLSKVEKAILEAELELKNSSQIQRILADRTKLLEAGEAALSERKSRENELESRFNRLLKEENEFAKKREEGLAKISESYQKSSDAILKKHLETVDSINQKVAAKAGELAGLGGGLEANAGLPLNVLKAEKKVQKQANKDRFNSLRDATQGLSSNDLAANNGALLKQVLTQQAEKEVGADALFKDATETFFAESAKADAARAEAEKDFIATIEKDKATTTEAFEATRAALSAAADSIRTITEEVKATKKEIEAITRALDKVSSSVRL